MLHSRGAAALGFEAMKWPHLREFATCSIVSELLWDESCGMPRLFGLMNVLFCLHRFAVNTQDQCESQLAPMECVSSKCSLTPVADQEGCSNSEDGDQTKRPMQLSVNRQMWHLKKKRHLGREF